MKRLYILLVFICLIAVGYVCYLFSSMESRLQNNLRDYGSKIVGTEVLVDVLEIRLFSGEVLLENLKISNPDSYENKDFITAESAHVKFSFFSLFSDVLYIDEVKFERVSMTVEPLSIMRSNLMELKEKLLEERDIDVSQRVSVDEIFIDGINIKEEFFLSDKTRDIVTGKIVVENIKDQKVDIVVKKVLSDIFDEASQFVSKKDIDFKAVATRNLLNAISDIKEKVDSKGIFGKMDEE